MKSNPKLQRSSKNTSLRKRLKNNPITVLFTRMNITNSQRGKSSHQRSSLRYLASLALVADLKLKAPAPSTILNNLRKDKLPSELGTLTVILPKK
jgi:hypothetical protein